MQMHILALTIGFFLDLWLGDPWHWPHVVKFIGKRIERAEHILRRLVPASPPWRALG